MFVPFSTLSPDARIWIYQADRRLSSSEKSVVDEKLKEFTGQWLVHGAPLEASFEIKFDQFVILAANDTASGCSIDSSVRIMKEVGNLTGIDFFNRNQIAFKSGEEITLINLTLLKTEFLKGTWGEETPVFNNVVTTLRDLKEGWLVPARTTWLRRYLTKPQSVQ